MSFLSARSRQLRVFRLMNDIFVYRKGLTYTIVKEKENECELARRKGRRVLAIGDKDMEREQPVCAQSVHTLPERNSDLVQVVQP